MTPQHLIIKAKALNLLTDHIWDNQPQNQKQKPDFISNEEITLVHNDKTDLLDRVLAVYKSGKMTVEDYLFHYKLDPQKIEFTNRQSIFDGIQNSVGIYVRDKVLSDYALTLGLATSEKVVSDVRTDRERMLSDLLREKLYDGLKKNGQSGDQLRARLENRTANLLDSLRKATPIQIDDTALLEVHTSDEGLSRTIDFTAIRTQ